jgi:uncharacterized membrane protein
MSYSASSLPGLLLGIIFAVISSLFFAMDYNKITGYILCGCFRPKTGIYFPR